jgi:hypothetical protein
MTDDYVDGNALAGPLAEVFAFDISASSAACAGCGRTGVLAELHVYAGGPGRTGRCPGCAEVMLRYAETPYGRWLDLRGTAMLRLDPATG